VTQRRGPILEKNTTYGDWSRRNSKRRFTELARIIKNSLHCTGLVALIPRTSCNIFNVLIDSGDSVALLLGALEAGSIPEEIVGFFT
jgi:hypothetical protein